MTGNLKYCLLILLSLFALTKTAAQNNTLSSYVVNKKFATNVSSSRLSSNVVTAIAQDENGMMWFGTKRGLNSFDSYNFEEYNQFDDIINATITDILPVGDTLFIGTERGLCIYDTKNRKATNFFSSEEMSVLPDNHIYNIGKPVNGRVTICTKSGTSVYDLKKKTFYIPKVSGYFPEYEVRDIMYIDYDGSWRLATSNGLVSYHEENHSISHYYYIKDVQNSLPDNSLRCMHKISDSVIFVGTSNGLCKFNAIDNEIKRINLNELTSYKSSRIDISKIISFNDEEIMISTYTDGLYIYNIENEDVTYISKFAFNKAISDNYVFDIYKDQNGSVWVATFTDLNRIENKLANFSTITIPNKNTTLSINYFLEMPDNKILVGTDSGIKIFNIEDLSITDFQSYFNSKEDYFESLYVYSFFLDKEQYLWVGTRSNGAYVYDIKSDKLINVVKEFDIPELEHAVIREIVRDKYDKIWLATNIGLCCINLKDKTHHIYKKIKNDDSSITYDDVYDLLLNDKDLYVTTGDGLAVYHYATNDFSRYYLPDSITKEDVVINNGFFDIIQAEDGIFYIGSYSKGMVSFNPKTETFKTSKIKETPGVMYYAVVPDNKGYLWASTSKGIVKYDLKTKDITNYDVRDGLQGDEFVPNAFLRTKSGYVFFGGYNGFNYFKPEDIKVEKKIPQPIVTKLQTYSGKTYRYFRHADTVHLTNNDNTFEISFATLNLLRNSMARYSCMLENYDTEWMTYEANHRYVYYDKLHPGTYVFKLRAANESNIWNQEPFELTIIIHPSWYQKTSFNLFVIFVLFSIIFLFIRQRRKIVLQKREHKRKINDLEVQMAQLKQKTLQLQMNPHVIFNTLNSIQQYILEHDIENATIYLSSFSKLMRSILNNSNERYILLSEECEAVKLYLQLESMRLGNRFTYEMTISPELDADNIEVAPLVIQPFVENAIIHGLIPKKDNCILKIRIDKISEDHLSCVVEDNGVGRVYSERQKLRNGGSHKSYGMSITKRRLEMLSRISNEDFSVHIEDLYNDKGEAQGTRVNLVISYHK